MTSRARWVLDSAPAWSCRAPSACFGRPAVSYVVEPRGVDRCRVVAGIDDAAPSSVLGNVLLTLLAFGDLSIMREQLLTLKRCAERTAKARARR